MNKNIVVLTLLIGVVLFAGLSGTVSADSMWQETPYGDDVTEFEKDEIVDIMDSEVSELDNSEIDLVIYWVEYHGYDALSSSERTQYDTWLPQAMSQYDYSDEEVENSNESLLDVLGITSSDSEVDDEELYEDATEIEVEEDNESDSAEGVEFDIEEYIEVMSSDYVDRRPSSSVEDGRLIYSADGPVQRIYFSDEVEVLDYSVDENARFQFDSRDNAYVLETEQTGTHTLRFSVEYEGVTYDRVVLLQVDTVDYVHITDEEHSKLLADSASWRHTERTFSDYCDSREACEDIVEEAHLWYEFRQNPLSALQGQTVQILIILFTWEMGLIMVSASLIAVLVWSRKQRKENQRYRSQMSVIGDIDTEKLERNAAKLKSFLSQAEYQDLGFTDTESMFLRENLGTNPLQGLKTLMDILPGMESLVRIYLRGYEDKGWSVVDDGETAELVDNPDVGVSPTEVSAETIERIELTTLNPDVLEGTDAIQEEIEAASESIVDELNVRLKEDGYEYAVVDNRSEMAALLASLMRRCASRDEVTGDGYIRPESDFLNLLMNYINTSSEKYQIPIWMYRDLLIETKERLDEEEELQSDIDDIKKYGDIKW